jgi:polysaccharide biosynthesis protein PslH
MRILYVLPYVPSPIRVRPFNLIRQLAKRHEIDVLAIGSSRDAEDAAVLRSVCRSVEIFPFSWSAGLANGARGAVVGLPLQATISRSRQLERRLREILDLGDVDVLHVEHLRAALSAFGLSRRIPTVFDSVDCISMLLRRTLASSDRPAQRIISMLEIGRVRSFESRLLGEFDRVAVTSGVDARALESLAPGRHVAIVSNGVDLEYFHPLDGPKEESTLVFSGKMSYHANVTAVTNFVRDVFPLVRRVRSEARLRIVGSQPPAAVRGLGKRPGISVTGYLPDIREAIGRATVAVCPITVKAGVQNKILEAMSMGVPVVSSRLGIEGLSVLPGRDLLVADSPTEFAEQIRRVLEEPSVRGDLARAGRAYVESEHRWSTAAEQFEALYAEALRSRNAGT